MHGRSGSGPGASRRRSAAASRDRGGWRDGLRRLRETVPARRAPARQSMPRLWRTVLGRSRRQRSSGVRESLSGVRAHDASPADGESSVAAGRPELAPSSVDDDGAGGACIRMNTTSDPCDCPQVPDFSEMSTEQIDRMIGKPLRCTSCGGELELRCPEGHLHQAPRTRSPNHRPAVQQDVDRTCAAGHRMAFRQRVCLVCHPKAEPRSHRTYAPKPCAQCRREFQPTGPRALFCKRDDCHA